MIQKQLVLLDKNKADAEVRALTMERWASAKSLFNQVVLAGQEKDMQIAWALFLHEFSHPIFKEPIEYIQNRWMSVNKSRRFLRCYLEGVLHFNEIASSRVEAAHSRIKRDLKTSTGDILSTMQCITRTVLYTNKEALRSIEEQQHRIVIALNIPLFKDVLRSVARAALWQVQLSWQRYSQTKHPLPEPCNNYRFLHIGIPCNHTVKKL
jgi:hypothetical protein